MPTVRGWDRLRRADEFQRVRQAGRRLRAETFDAYVLRRSDDRGPRLGIAASRKVGSAVIRNRWKRIVREYVRLHAGALGAVDLVIVPRTTPPASLGDFAAQFEAQWKHFRR